MQLKNPELNLQNANRLLDLILDNIPDLIYVKDSKGNIITSNKAFDIFYQNNLEFKKKTSKHTHDKSAPINSDYGAIENNKYQETFCINHNNKLFLMY